MWSYVVDLNTFCGALFWAIMCLSVIILALTPTVLQSKTLKVIRENIYAYKYVNNPPRPVRNCILTEEEINHPLHHKAVVFTCPPRDIYKIRYIINRLCIAIFIRELLRPII